MSKSKKETYLRLIKGIFAQISVLPKDKPEEFERLKKKLNRYHKKFESLPS